MNEKYNDNSYLVFFKAQNELWAESALHYDELNSQCITKELSIQSNKLKVQFNPARVQSNKAAVDNQSIKKRACFLCLENRPKVQMSKKIATDHLLLVNPFPILPVHFTIAADTHRPQSILSDFESFQRIIQELPEMIVFYNGPKCGASAPDHQHFQAGSKGIVPIEANWTTDYEPHLQRIFHGLYYLPNYPMPVFALYCHRDIDTIPFFKQFYQTLQSVEDTAEEPMMNLIGWQKSPKEQIILIIPRSKHRPDVYFGNNKEQMFISPGAIDVGGLLITINKEDFNRLTAHKAYSILQEVGITQKKAQSIIAKIKPQTKPQKPKIPLVRVGLTWNKEINFCLNKKYLCEGIECLGEESVQCKQNKLYWHGNAYDSLCFHPISEGLFTLPKVTIGRSFHWQQEDSQRFTGSIQLIAHNNQAVFINEIDVETYLKSVICSEMNANSPFEFLKASAIISRSWLLSKLRKNKRNKKETCGHANQQEIIRWYEQSDHNLFDVCADDHCQRYQGVDRIQSDKCLLAVEETKGQVLLYQEEICDARFSKCCGGITETFSTCWEDKNVPYLIAHWDKKELYTTEATETFKKNVLTKPMSETEAETWISNTKRCFCNTKSKKLLHTILNDYDQKTHNFYRWNTSISQEQLQEWISSKLDIDLGNILELTPVERGPGGRLRKLLIQGSKGSITIGKELEIRRILSDTHLYSAAFVVQKGETENGIPKNFILHGAGWGHGVGMCQIGAAVMAHRGYNEEQILRHYFPETQIKKLY